MLQYSQNLTVVEGNNGKTANYIDFHRIIYAD